ncbi:TetR/AcrR family transcriptional regulator [Mucilaginibacter antarcticus]|uniref:TetR/AcrR family transcriptional regulator n=1 Tax=Mucilaginibacter antarcticus TaxID=1855725 RepID=A0ABW5XUU8_9SPHI
MVSVLLENDVRESVLQKAEVLFALHGYEETSMDKVAEATGINHRILRGYFKTKRLLYMEIFHIRLNRLRILLAGVPGLKSDSPERLMIFSNIYAMTFKNTAFLCLMQREISFWPYSVVRDQIDQSIKNTLQTLVTLVDIAVNEYYITDIERPIVFQSVISTMPVMGMGSPVDRMISDTIDPHRTFYSGQRVKMVLLKMMKDNQTEFIYRA